MNGNLDQKEESVIEEALKLKDGGRRLSYIIGKFPDHKSEIREVFGTVVFIKEKKDKIIAPKNILKTLLSRIPDNSPTEFSAIFKKENAREDVVYDAPFTEAEEDEGGKYSDFSTASEDDEMFSKWKVIAPMIILAVVTGIILFRGDSRMKNKAINQENNSSQNLNALNFVPNADGTSSSTKKGNM